jgi:hypothetical protein
MNAWYVGHASEWSPGQWSVSHAYLIDGATGQRKTWDKIMGGYRLSWAPFSLENARFPEDFQMYGTYGKFYVDYSHSHTN